MKRETGLVLLLLVTAAPAAAAFTVETEPESGHEIDLGVRPENATVVRPYVVHVNCTLGEVFPEGIRVTFDDSRSIANVTVDIDPKEVALEDPIVCSQDRAFRFETNVTFAFPYTIDARYPEYGEISGSTDLGVMGLDQARWPYRIQQAYQPATDVYLPDGFVFNATAGSVFRIPIQVAHHGNAPVQVSTEVREVSPYRASFVSAPREVEIDAATDGRAIERTLFLVGRTLSGIGNINQTLVLELRITITPQDVPFAEFFTTGRLFVVHVHVAKEHLSTEGASPAPPPASLLVLVGSLALALRRRAP